MSVSSFLQWIIKWRLGRFINYFRHGEKHRHLQKESSFAKPRKTLRKTGKYGLVKRLTRRLDAMEEPVEMFSQRAVVASRREVPETCTARAVRDAFNVAKRRFTRAGPILQAVSILSLDADAQCSLRLGSMASCHVATVQRRNENTERRRKRGRGPCGPYEFMY